MPKVTFTEDQKISFNGVTNKEFAAGEAYELSEAEVAKLDEYKVEYKKSSFIGSKTKNKAEDEGEPEVKTEGEPEGDEEGKTKPKVKIKKK